MSDDACACCGAGLPRFHQLPKDDAGRRVCPACGKDPVRYCHQVGSGKVRHLGRCSTCQELFVQVLRFTVEESYTAVAKPSRAQKTETPSPRCRACGETLQAHLHQQRADAARERAQEALRQQRRGVDDYLKKHPETDIGAVFAPSQERIHQ